MPDKPKDASEQAKALSALGSAKGGRARAEALTQEERREIARTAALARWAKASPQPPKALHDGSFTIGNTTILCAVLETKKRVLTQESFLTAVGRAGKAKGGKGSVLMVDGLPPFLAAENLRPFISDELLQSTTPIMFRTVRGQKAFGYDAELLPQVCEVYLKAREEGALLGGQKHIAKACEILMRGLAKIGIIALVDEATGYQDFRARDDLARILEAFVARELRPWVRTFTPDFYKELFRLKGLPYPPRLKKPRYIGILTNNLVYQRLAPGVLKELQAMNPVTDTGRRKHKHFQWLTDDIGHPKLREHLAAVTALMRASQSWDSFKGMLDRALPKYKVLPLFDRENEEGEA
ncbi:MAG: P63C domain-containing protein [Candidatus Polarisedimenticolia bacterium]